MVDIDTSTKEGFTNEFENEYSKFISDLFDLFTEE